MGNKNIIKVQNQDKKGLKTIHVLFANKPRKLIINWFIFYLLSIYQHIALSLQSQCWTPCSDGCPVWSLQRSISWSTVRSPSPLTCAAWWARLRVWPDTTFWLGWTRLAWRLQEGLASECGDATEAVPLTCSFDLTLTQCDFLCWCAGTWLSGCPMVTPPLTCGHWISNASATYRAVELSCDTEWWKSCVSREKIRLTPFRVWIK